MKNIILIIVFVLFGCSKTTPESYIKIIPLSKYENSIYSYSYKNGPTYYADVIIQKCFALISRTSFELSCIALKKRPEWKPIITWVDN